MEEVSEAVSLVKTFNEREIIDNKCQASLNVKLHSAWNDKLKMHLSAAVILKLLAADTGEKIYFLEVNTGNKNYFLEVNTVNILACNKIYLGS